MKILFLQKRILFPADTGWKIRTLNVLRHLAEWHDVTYLCNVQPDDVAHLSEMRELGVRLETVPWVETPRGSWRFYASLALNTLSRYPYTVAKDYDSRLCGRAAQLLAGEQFDLVICDFVQMARNAFGLTVPAKILFQHNVEAQIFRRHVEQDSSPLRRAYMALQWRKMRRFESAAGRQFDAVIAVSDKDAGKFAKDYGWRHVQTIDTAVDVKYFCPNGRAEQTDRIVFVGSMDWLPNQDAVRDFVENAWPSIRQARPEAQFQIVGRNPSSELENLAHVPGVEVIGTVPDVRPYVAEASVVVVPLRIGGGTRIKIYEALAMQRAVVSTALGAEGLPVKSGEHLLVADDHQSFARAVIELLENSPRRAALATAGRQLVQERFSSEQVARQFDTICCKTVEAARKQSTATLTKSKA